MYSSNDIIQIIPWVYIMCLTGGKQGFDDHPDPITLSSS
nr:MAG TPA: hypothetical protein [Caudoviricetes sp.]DAV03543.1 MAG TPA: hypothetical protein [Caudoviricetes sp.]